MGNFIIAAVLAAVMIVAVRSGFKHLKGEGGCCGGSGDVISDTHKTLENAEIGKKIIRIEGMSCDKCKARVERAINRIDGAVCEVDLKSGCASVRYDRPLNDKELRLAVTQLDYKVLSIENA